MKTIEEYEELKTKEWLDDRIRDNSDTIKKYRKGIDVLRSSDDFSNPFTQGRIAHLQKIIGSYEEEISTWQKILDTIPVEPTR
jgi:hypothetical protein